MGTFLRRLSLWPELLRRKHNHRGRIIEHNQAEYTVNYAIDKNTFYRPNTRPEYTDIYIEDDETFYT